MHYKRHTHNLVLKYPTIIFYVFRPSLFGAGLGSGVSPTRIRFRVLRLLRQGPEPLLTAGKRKKGTRGFSESIRVLKVKTHRLLIHWKAHTYEAGIVSSCSFFVVSSVETPPNYFFSGCLSKWDRGPPKWEASALCPS